MARTDHHTEQRAHRAERRHARRYATRPQRSAALDLLEGLAEAAFREPEAA